MSEPAEKARALRLARLKMSLDVKVERPEAVLEALISELEAGDPQPALWETLHRVVARDGMEGEVATVYVKAANSQRVAKLRPDPQVAFLLHAADYLQGVRGDVAMAQGLLERASRIVPGHPEVYARLVRRMEASDDPRRALELYASAATAPPIPAATLATSALHKVLLLRTERHLPPDICKQLVLLSPHNPRLLFALEAHCRGTKRFALACVVLEEALLDPTLAEEHVAAARRLLLDLYLGDAAEPAKAIDHVEVLLKNDPGERAVRAVAERLLSVREVASRAAAALQTARRSRPPPRPGP